MDDKQQKALPPRLWAIASGVLKYVERVEKRNTGQNKYEERRNKSDENK